MPQLVQALYVGCGVRRCCKNNLALKPSDGTIKDRRYFLPQDTLQVVTQVIVAGGDWLA